MKQRRNTNFRNFHSIILSAMRAHAPSLADPAVCFGGGQLGEVTQTRVPPKLKTPRIWPTVFGEWPKITYKNKKYIRRKTKKSGFRSLVHHGSLWLFGGTLIRSERL